MVSEWTSEKVAALLEPLTGYTPGPLFHDGWTGVRVVGAVDTWSGPVLATIVRCEDTTQIDGEGRVWECDGGAECNARLIAAAPDLVDALRAVAAERDAALADSAKLRRMLGDTVCYACEHRIGADVPRFHICVSCKTKREYLARGAAFAQGPNQ